MTPDQKVTDAEQAVDNKLIHFEGEADNPPTRDINHKLSSLEEGLNQLKAELSAINVSVEEGLDRLSDTDTDLTAKVSETYKRLGEIDNAYKALIDISVRLDTEILKVTQNVSEVAEQSMNGLKNLEETSVAKNTELAEKNQQVVSRVNALVENSRSVNDHLAKSIKENTASILALESRLVGEIESLANTSREQAESIEMQQAAQKARIIKLQQVDEAIIRRANTLEITADELTQKAGAMTESIHHLEDQSADLTEKVVDLMVHTQQLQDASDKHAGLIEGVQNNIAEMSRSLLALTHLERKHFRFLSAAFVLVLCVVAGLYFYQQRALQSESENYAQRSDQLEQAVTTLQSNDSAATQAVSTLDSRLGELNSEVGALDNEVKQNLDSINQQFRQSLQQLERKLAGMGDYVQSLDGRLNSSLLVDPIGSDNIIHGAQWLAQQPADNYVIQLTTVNDKNALYEIAQRYNYYLKDKLSYTTLARKPKPAYTLLYGNYPDQKKARQVLQDMPRYIESQRPHVRQIKDLVRM